MKNLLLTTVLIFVFISEIYSQQDYCGLSRDEIFVTNYKLYPLDNTGSYNMDIGTIVFVDMENKIVKSFLMDEKDICYRSMFLYFDMKMFPTLRNYMRSSGKYVEVECSTSICRFIFRNKTTGQKSFIILQKGDNEVILSTEIVK